MDTVKIMAIALLGIFLSQGLKEHKQYAATAVAASCLICLAFMLLPYLEKVVSYVKVFASSADVRPDMLLMIKITGIGILSTLCADMCKDAGFNAIASAVILSGKAICMCMTLPVVGNFIAKIVSVLP